MGSHACQRRLGWTPSQHMAHTHCQPAVTAPIRVDEPTWRSLFASTGGVAVQDSALPPLMITSGVRREPPGAVLVPQPP